MKGNNNNLIEKSLAITPIKVLNNESIFSKINHAHSLENSVIN